MKKALLTTLILILFAVGSNAFAQSQAELNGLSYLTNIQNGDGSLSGNVTTDFYSTFTVLDTLRIFDRIDLSYQLGFQWIQAYPPENIDYLTKRIVLLSQNNISATDEVTLLISLRDPDSGGWGLKEAFKGEIQDSALALQSLKAVNYPDQNVISSAITYLTSTQNSDGGWGFYQGDDSNVYMTALVLNTLSQFKSTYSLQTPINNAVAYLLSKQNPDGGFGSSPSTVYETALTFEALISSGTVEADKATIMQNAINYLTVTQLPNGSWNDDPYSTALALRALANIKPNLSISSTDITFSNQTPTRGETVTVTAAIHNSGPAQADNVLVRFFDGDPLAGGGINIG